MRLPGRGIVGLIVCLATAGIIPRADAEEETPPGWSHDLVGGLGFTQTEFENYAEGGESSLTWTLSLDYRILEFREKREWKTEAEIQFGQTRVGDGDFRKAADKIALASIHTWKLASFLNPFVSVDGRTQVAKGFTYDGDIREAELSRFGNPVYFNQAAGVGRTWSSGVSTRLGAAVHEVFVSKDLFAPGYTDDPATPELEKSRVDVGVESITEFEKHFEEDEVVLKTSFRLFSSFEDPANLDLWWTTKATANIISFINVILEVTVLYDEDILKRTQLKEVLALGITKTFF